MDPAFAIWITGLPASGKSTITQALVKALSVRHVDVAVLESDVLRRVLTPHPTYSEEERETFYGAMTFIGSLLVAHEVPVIFDATANRRTYRTGARVAIQRFIEIYVDCPIAVCVARDPKGIYRQAHAGRASTVPGVQAAYEPPEHAEAIVSGNSEEPQVAVQTIMRILERKGYVKPASSDVGRRHDR